MLALTVEGEEYYDEETSEFSYPNAFVLHLEHSLVSLSKWESKYEKPFLGIEHKSNDEVLDYIRMMIQEESVDPDVLWKLSQTNIQEINKYIDSKATATTFREDPGTRGRNQDVITSELIYYWMVAYAIPWEAQYWHLNRLFALIRVCDVKNSDKKPGKMSRNEMLAQRQRINAQRRAQNSSNG